MKAVLCRELGPPESLIVAEMPDPAPGADEVLIDIAATAVNFADALVVQGKYQHRPPLPFTPGVELAGTVAALGPGVTGLAVGDRVAGFTPTGGFAERAVVKAGSVVPIGGLPFDIAATLPTNYGTSHHALHRLGGVVAGDTVLVMGAAGGVGLAAVELAKAAGARVIAAASSPEKLAICRDHGADFCIDYEHEDMRAALKAATGGTGPSLILDPVGGAFAEPAFRSLAWHGRYLVVGFANGEIPKLPLNLALLKEAKLIGVFWGEAVRREPSIYRETLAAIVAATVAGKLRPHVSARYRLAETGAALRALLDRKVTGKVVVMP